MKTRFQYRYILEKEKVREKDTDEQPLPDKPLLIECGETYSTLQ